MFAVASNEYEAVKFLLEKGANPNEETRPKGITALNMAVNRNETKILELLIANGGDISVRKHFDNDPPNSEPSEGLLTIATAHGNKTNRGAPDQKRRESR